MINWKKYMKFDKLSIQDFLSINPNELIIIKNRELNLRCKKINSLQQILINDKLYFIPQFIRSKFYSQLNNYKSIINNWIELDEKSCLIINSEKEIIFLNFISSLQLVYKLHYTFEQFQESIIYQDLNNNHKKIIHRYMEIWK